MKSRAEELDALAASAKPGDRISYEAWLPASMRLRGKGWTFDQIYDFLKKAGERVPKPGTFKANMSRRLKGLTVKLTERQIQP